MYTVVELVQVQNALDAFSSNIEFSGFSVQEMAIKFSQICVLAVITLMIFIYLLLNHKEKVMKIVGWFLGFTSEKWAEKIKHLLDEFSTGCQVVKNFFVRVEGIILKYHSDIPLFGFHMGYGFTIDIDFAGGWILKTCYNA